MHDASKQTVIDNYCWFCYIAANTETEEIEMTVFLAISGLIGDCQESLLGVCPSFEDALQAIEHVKDPEDGWIGFSWFAIREYKAGGWQTSNAGQQMPLTQTTYGVGENGKDLIVKFSDRQIR